MAFREGDTENAFRLLREAVSLEEKLSYDEPPGWMQPVRHALGALLLADGRCAEAEQVYRDDLIRHPKNPWSLLGLKQSLEQQDKGADAELISEEVQRAWARADVIPVASCYCHPDARSGGGQVLRAELRVAVHHHSRLPAPELHHRLEVGPLHQQGRGPAVAEPVEAHAAVAESAVSTGQVSAFVGGSTAAITTMELEPGGVHDLRELLDRSEPVVLHVVRFNIPPGEPITIPADDPGC